MIHRLVSLRTNIVVFLILTLIAAAEPAVAEERMALDEDVYLAIAKLMETTPAAKELAGEAKGILVFPNIVKAGFIVGVQYGGGALVRGSPESGYYITDHYGIAAASYGLQAGVQSFGYALMLMTDTAVRHVETSSGWELGSGPSIVVVNAGMAKTLTTKTAKKDIYAFTFGQKGLMAGLALGAAKVTKLED